MLIKFILYAFSILLIALSFKAKAADSPVAIRATAFDLKKGVPKEVIFEIKNISKNFICIVERDVPTNPKYPTIGLFGKNNSFIERKQDIFFVNEGLKELPNFILVPPKSSHFSIQPIRKHFKIKSKNRPFDMEISFRFLDCALLIENNQKKISSLSELLQLETHRVKQEKWEK